MDRYPALAPLEESHPYLAQIRLLFQAAMLIFLITVGIGILNGLKVIHFERPQLLTHVHAGTLGWITLGSLATGLWLFGANGRSAGNLLRGLSWIIAICVPIYVIAFWTGNFWLRGATGIPVLVVIVGFFIWLASQGRASGWTVPRLGVLAAVLTLVIGSSIGVVVQFQLASNTNWLPDGAIAGHAGAQVVGYLVLIAMSICEWRLQPPTARLSKLGVAQVVLLFLGGLLVSIGAMLNSQPLLGSFIPFEIIALAFFIWRLAPRLAKVRWLEAGSERQFALMAPFLVLDVLLLVYLITATLTGIYADFTLTPTWLVFAFDHAMFIGVMTNGLFGLIFEVTRTRRTFWPWADQVLFWGMNAGMIGFVITLLSNTPELERVFTPIMGGSILVVILTYSLRLQRRAGALQQAAAPA